MRSLDYVRCASCDRIDGYAVMPLVDTPRHCTSGEVLSLAALRGGWLYYHPTGAWSCPACVARSDHGGAEYRAALRRMVDRVRKAMAL
jgi:hypothetical protein